MTDDHFAHWLRLTLTPQVGRVTARRLLAAFGLPAEIFRAGASAWAQVATPLQVQALEAEPPELAACVEATAHWLAQDPGRRVLTLADGDYPAGLLQTDDPPLLLYAMGDALAAPGPVAWPEGLAIVGSRNPTPQGADNARQFAKGLAQAGWSVVSGLALGVDACAHEGALEGAVPGHIATIAAVGTGLDRVYPRQHQPLARRIARQGLIVSEYPLGTPPLAENFPQRNRIISALARGTLVVEAAVQSGSLITARFAVEQGREVFAIPGSIHSPQSRGCHALIRQGAKLVETVQDVLDELATPGTTHNPAPVADPAATREGTHDGDALWAALGFEPVTLDALGARTGLCTATLQARLLEFELEGHVARLPGGLFQRRGRA